MLEWLLVLTCVIITWSVVSPLLTRVARFGGFGTPPSPPPHLPPSKRLRIGVLGAARITEQALLIPSRWNPHVELRAISSKRHLPQARQLAAKYAIPHVYASHEEVLNDPNVDAVYIPLPNGSHFYWARRALQAGKHVLCEKPFTANASEASDLAQCALACNRVVMEACHNMYHPVLREVRRLVATKTIGEVLRIEASFHSRIAHTDIRFNCAGSNSSLAGGSMMDNGIYALHAITYVSGLTVDEVEEACSSDVRYSDVDACMKATLRLGDGRARGYISASFTAWTPWEFVPVLKVTGVSGTLTVLNYLLPNLWHVVRLTRAHASSEYLTFYDQGGTTYEYQLSEFVRRCEEGREGVDKDELDPVEAMRVIDEIYIKAGLKPRQGILV